MSKKEALKIIDDVITREIEWADDPTDDIQEAWNIIRIVFKQYFGDDI